MDCSLPGSSIHGISQARHLSGLPFNPPGDLPNPGTELTSPALAGGFFTTEPPGESDGGVGESLLIEDINEVENG